VAERHQQEAPPDPAIDRAQSRPVVAGEQQFHVVIESEKSPRI